MHIDADFAASLSVKGDSLKGSTELERLATRLHLIEVVLLKLFLRLFELIFVISGLFFVNLLVFLSFFKFGLSLRELFLSLLQAFFQVIF